MASDLETSRRGFLGTAAASLTVAGGAQPARSQAPASPRILPTRKLGKTGVEVTILNLGTWRNPGLDRLLRLAYAQGIRMYDTAKSYGSEPAIRGWLQERTEVRSSIFLVTKDSPRQPADLAPMVDQRLKSLGVDQLDLFFIHALGDHNERDGLSWPRSAEWGRAADKLKSAGKIRFFGFSTHHRRRAEYLQAAAQGGFVDVIMLQYSPWLETDAPLNRALDACHAKGIGLISMKQVAGQFNPNGPLPDVLREVERRVPVLQERNLTVFGGLLHAIWTDPRISAACVSMRNTDQIRENADAARRFEPLKLSQIHSLRDASLAHGRTLCADCDGRCMAAAGTSARLDDLTRYLTYYEHHGLRSEARRLYAELSDVERDHRGADLDAARQACPGRLNFAQLLRRVDQHLA
jgi:aryl-alcohol dehydrogenase-like predicted oxidoreductase